MRRAVTAELIANPGVWINGADLAIIGGGHEAVRRWREVARDPAYRVDGYLFECMRSERGRWLYRALVATTERAQLRLWETELYPPNHWRDRG